ncbi:MAG: hypothetical protein QW835_06940 [Candidatus Hadarchaeum sp.]
MAGDRTAKKVYQKLRYGTAIELGRVERLVLAATPDTSVGNNFLPAAHIAEKAGLTLNQTCGALRRLLKKGYVDCLRPFEDRLVTWTSWPFFEKCPEIARELF